MRSLPAFLLAAAAAPLAAQPACVPRMAVPGFAPGQARAADRLAVGSTVALALKPAATVRYALPLARRPVAASFGGTFPLTVVTAGTYHIALSGKVWIDVVRGTTALVSTAHQHGAPCAGIAKIVTFRLEPGTYDVQLSEADAPAITAKVMREGVIPLSR